MWSTQRVRQRTVYRRRRRLALLTVLVGIMVGVAAQAGVSLPSFMSVNEDLASGGSSGGIAQRPGPGTDEALAEGTVLSTERTVPEPLPEETSGEATSEGGATESEEEETSEEPEPSPPASGEPLYVLVLGVDRRPSEAGGAPAGPTP